MFVKILRYLIGYVSFTATGNSIERFINIIARSGITIWDIKNFKLSEKNDVDKKQRSPSRGMSAKVIASDYKLLRPIAKKSGLRLKVEKKCGLPFIIKKYRKRLGMLVGVIVLIATVYMLSLYIWVVNVDGNVELSNEQIKTVVSDLGLKPGVLKKYVNVSEIEHNTMIKFDNLAWVSVNVEGCFATVSVNESLKPPTIVPKGQPCNIKANQSGQIIRMEVYEGSSEVKNGDAVVKGQLLVSGIVEDSFKGHSIHHASAKAIAATKHDVQEKVELKSAVRKPTGKKVRKRRLHILGLDIPITLQFTPEGTYTSSTKTDILKIGNVPLPVSIYTEEFCEQTEEIKILSNEEAKQTAEEKLSETKKQYFEKSKITREDKSDYTIDGVYYLNDVIYCEEDIAVEEALNLLTG